MSLPVIYVAGPFRGANAWEIAQNVRRAEQVGLEVAKAGAMPLIPHANTHLFHGQLSEDFWVEGTKELLRRCDAIVMVPGWLRSSGARGELEEARELGLPALDLGHAMASDPIPSDALVRFVEMVQHRAIAGKETVR